MPRVKKADPSAITPSEFLALESSIGRPEQARRILDRHGVERVVTLPAINGAFDEPIMSNDDGTEPVYLPARTLLPPLLAALRDLPVSPRDMSRPQLVELRWKIGDEEWTTSFEADRWTNKPSKRRKDGRRPVDPTGTLVSQYRRLLEAFEDCRTELEKLRLEGRSLLPSDLVANWAHVFPSLAQFKLSLQSDGFLRLTLTFPSGRQKSLDESASSFVVGDFSPRQLVREFVAFIYDDCSPSTVDAAVYNKTR